MPYTHRRTPRTRLPAHRQAGEEEVAEEGEGGEEERERMFSFTKYPVKLRPWRLSILL